MGVLTVGIHGRPVGGSAQLYRYDDRVRRCIERARRDLDLVRDSPFSEAFFRDNASRGPCAVAFRVPRLPAQRSGYAARVTFRGASIGFVPSGPRTGPRPGSRRGFRTRFAGWCRESRLCVRALATAKGRSGAGAQGWHKFREQGYAVRSTHYYML